MRVIIRLLIVVAVIITSMTLGCLPSKADEPPATVLYLPLVSRNNLEQSERPQLISPTDGTQLDTLAPEFVWRSTGEHWYSLEISTDPQFSTVALSVPPCTRSGGPEYRMALLTNLQQETLYYWRVGYDDDTGFFTWSHVGWFITSGPGPATPPAPLPSMPTNGSTVDSLSPYLGWQGVPEATMYHITLGVQGNMFTFSVLSPAASQIIPFSLLPGRTYAWHVRALNGYAWGPESTTWVFRTPAN